MTSPMKILALDPATKCGWAYSQGTTEHICWSSGVWDLSIRPDESSGMRLIRLRGKLQDMHRAGLGLVVFEAGRNTRNGRAVAVAGELQGVIKLWCQDNEIEFKGYSPTEIKRHATGKGNADKDAMTNAAFARWPDKRITSCDEADALWLLDLAMEEFGAAP